MAGRGYSEEKSRSIMDSQLSDKAFREHCRIIIDNNGNVEDTRESVKNALKECGIIPS